MKDFFIVGNHNICGEIKECLICLCANEEQAQKRLKEVIANPPAKCLGNIHIENADSEKCWWNQGSLD